MKNVKWILSLLLAIGFFTATLIGCSDDDTPADLTLQSLTAGSIDLNGATTVNTVPVTGTVITATFNTDVNPTTVTNSTVTLVEDYDQKALTPTLAVSGKTITITIDEPMGAGALHKLTFTSGVMSTAGKPIKEAIERDFSTIGAFAPSGAIAYWNFESNANDQIGSFSPAGASDIVDVSYVDGRNALAGKAASFNGTTSIIEIPNAPDLVNTSSLTLSIWIKPDSSAHHGGNFVLGAGGFNGLEFEINKNDGKLAADYALPTGTAATDLWLDGTGNTGYVGWTFSKDLTGSGGFASIVQQKWSHFVFTYNASTKVGTIYLNGEKVKSQDFNLYDNNMKTATDLKFNAAVGVGTKLAFGYYSDRSTTAYDWAHYSDTNTNHFKGLMDDVYIYHTVLSDALITQMYNSGK